MFSTVKKKIKSIITVKEFKNKHYNFLESLAENIFDKLFMDKRINKIKLKIEKLDAIKETTSVGIEITKKRIYV